jgi:hypothetical protein
MLKHVWRAIGWVLTVVSLCCALPSARGQVVYNSQNGHYYEVVLTDPRITWLEARAAAEARTYAGWRGHLVTQTSQQETDFLVANLDLGDHYLGAYQDTAALDYSEPAGGWRWVTGESWGYTNWIRLTNEPNEVEGGLENFTHYKTYVEPGAWNDIRNDHPIDGGQGYVVEYDPLLPVPVPEPSVTWIALGMLLGQAVWRRGRSRRRQ